MGIEDIRDSIKDVSATKWAEFKESSIYISLKEKYDDQPPSTQKFLKFLSLFSVVLLTGYLIWGNFSDASTSVEQFEAKKALIRELQKVKRDASSSPRITPPPPITSLKSRIDAIVESFQLNADQISDVNVVTSDSSSLVPSSVKQSGIHISLNTLNLTQAVDIGYRLQNVNGSVKLVDAEIVAQKKDPHYFDVKYKLIAFYPPVVKSEDDDSKKKSPRRRNRRKGKGN